MRAKEYLLNQYPEMEEEWGKTNHDEDFMCKMMEEYANHIVELAFEEEYPVSTKFINRKAKAVTFQTEKKIIDRVSKLTHKPNRGA